MATGRELPHGFREALLAARRILASSHELVRKGVIDTESEILVIEAFRKTGGKLLSRAELYSRLDDRYPEPAAQLLLTWAGARAEGRILQHLTEIQVFLDHEYETSPDTLVPRPETEFLVTVATEALRKEGAAPELGLELGLGTGVISIELLARFSRLRMLATELMPRAHAIASRNAERILGPSWKARLRVLRPKGPLEALEPFRPLVGEESGNTRADFLISNPPYLTRGDAIDDEVREQEPPAALFAPEQDPEHFYRRMAEQGPQLLRPGGFAFLELPHERAVGIQKIFKISGWDARILQDLAGRDRVLSARLPSGAPPRRAGYS
ncbi:MAG: hypothetical protein NDJ89_02660 [Oligoflexia bacterium]|nr:hypothetical protein [Oligoflexia bacterium]